MWFSDSVPPYHLGRIGPTGGLYNVNIDEAMGNIASSIVAGPDGNLWYTRPLSNDVARLQPDGATSKFDALSTNGRCSFGPNVDAPCTADGDCAGSSCDFGPGPQAITAGLDGNLWFVEMYAAKIGRLNPALADFTCQITPSTCITEFSLPSTLGYPSAITTGLDGSIWTFAEEPARFVRLVPAQATAACESDPTVCVTEFPLADSGGSGVGIATAFDGTIWSTVALEVGFKIVRLNPTLADSACETDATVCMTEFAVPTGDSAGGITAGNDGNMWFTDFFGNQVGKITPLGNVTLYTGLSHPPLGAITRGPDGNVWFGAEDVTNSVVARITPNGTITSYLAEAGLMTGITVGPDGNLWFTRQGSSTIGRVFP